MRTLKRLLAFVLALVMVLSLASMPAFAEAEDDGRTTYNIVINYVFDEDSSLVSDPYTANLAKGSSFKTTVNFPTVQGYLPYVDGEQQNSIELNYASVDRDETIWVRYRPTDVEYTVVHYRQNLDNDQYTPLLTETKKGLTGSQVPELAISEGDTDYDAGFYSLVYERPDIAADGSTKIEIYYDRYYRLMNFELDGGWGTDPIFARYGAEIGTVQNPEKAGYIFGGWSEVKGGTTPVTLPTTMPAEDTTYYAIWTAVKAAKVTIVFWGENANDEGYSYLKDPTREVYMAPGKEFTFDPTATGSICDLVHTHTDDCIGCGQTEHTHSVAGGCYTLTCDHTQHTLACYKVESKTFYTTSLVETTKPSQTLTDKGNGIYTYTSGWTTYYYLNIGDKWYCGHTKGNISDSEEDDASLEITLSCSHTHGDSCYTLTCTTPAHSHTAACYTCGMEEHSHNSNCYANNNLPESAKWKFVRSETVTVAADGSTVVNVYYDRVEYSVQFYTRGSYGNNSSEYTDLKITAKWGAYVGDQWPTKNGSSNWYVNPNGNGSSDPMQARLLIMPVGGDQFYGPQTGSGSSTATYYVEKLESTDSSKTSNYETHHTDTIPSSNATVTSDDKYDIEGFTVNGSLSTSNSSSYNNAKFYYTRNTFKVEYNNFVGASKTESAKYGASLNNDTFNWTPSDDLAPDIYEPGSVTFGGWYLNPQCSGDPYDFTGKTMPAGPNNEDGEVALVLYAKWVPVKHTVKFYLTEKSEAVYAPVDTDIKEASFTVPHGDNIAKEYVENHLTRKAMNEAKPNGDYSFVMWYYYDDNGVKTPFDPTTQIRKDLTLYGEWSSNTLKQYTVQYVLKSDHSVKLADDLIGSGLAGTTKTFDAKGGAELYADYQEGYFPTVQSQSLLLDIESNSLVITFEYVPMPAVPYTVKYVDKDSGESLADDKVVSDNRKAVVTETFKAISGYMPDAYQKRLVVTADSENILYFYYTKDTAHAYYKITHYIQNTDGKTWTEYASSQAVGDIGTRYTASQMTISGFTYDETKYMVNGVEATDVTNQGAKLTEGGLEINLYYVRNQYPYEFRFLVQGTNEPLAASVTGSAYYEAQVGQDAKSFAGYKLVNEEHQTITIAIEDPADVAVKNVKTFYYVPVYYIDHIQSGVKAGETDEYVITGPVNLTEKVNLDKNNKEVTENKTFLYGGTFESNYTTVAEFGDTNNPMSFTPNPGDHFYIWEVDADKYLTARSVSTWEHIGIGVVDVNAFYLVTPIDRELYQQVGFTVNGDTIVMDDEETDFEESGDMGKVVYKNLTLKYKDTTRADLVYDATTFGADEDDYLGLSMTPDNLWKDTKNTISFVPYWITMDNVKVTGAYERTYQYNGTGGLDDAHKALKRTDETKITSTCEYQAPAAEPAPLMLMASYSTADRWRVVTVNDTLGSYEQEVHTGDALSLTPDGAEGQLFAGWYSGDTLVDLKNITEDISVTAKYVSDDYLTLKYNRNGLFRVTGVTLVSAIDSDSYAETGFIINGETYVVDSYATRYRLFYTAGSLFGGDVARKAPLMTLDYALSGSGTLEVTPYWVTLDGTTVTGTTRTLTYTSRSIQG